MSRGRRNVFFTLVLLLLLVIITFQVLLKVLNNRRYAYVSMWNSTPLQQSPTSIAPTQPTTKAVTVPAIGSKLVSEPLNCSMRGWNYTLSLPTFDERSGVWLRDSGQAAILCGYGFAGLHKSENEEAIYVDVGANIGLTMLPYASRGWKVYAFEPIARNVAVLRANVERNGFQKSVRVVAAAASSKEGNTVIFVPAGREDYSALGNANTSKLNLVAGGLNTQVQKENIRLTTLDKELLGSSDFRPEKVKKIKVDTQGHEVEVLKGMTKLLKALPDSTLIEFEYDLKLQKASGHVVDELPREVRSLGFDIFCPQNGRMTQCIPTGQTIPCYDITLRRASSHQGGKCAG